MSNQVVHARTAALEQVGRGLLSLQQRTEAGASAFISALQRAIGMASDEVAQRKQRLAAAEQALQGARDEERAAAERAVQHARQQLEIAIKALRTIEGEAEAARSILRNHLQNLRDEVGRGTNDLRRMGAHLDTYQAGGARGGGGVPSGGGGGGSFRGGGGGGAGAGGGAAPSAMAAAVSARGLQLIDVRSVTMDESGSTNDHARSASDYRWLVEKWDTAVGPAVANGATRSDLAADDAASGAREGRRLADVYDVMLGDRAMKVNGAGGGRWSIEGGHQRLRAARQLGVRYIPVRVGGG